jgi:hypothetical protein
MDDRVESLQENECIFVMIDGTPLSTLPMQRFERDELDREQERRRR